MTDNVKVEVPAFMIEKGRKALKDAKLGLAVDGMTDGEVVRRLVCNGIEYLNTYTNEAMR